MKFPHPLHSWQVSAKEAISIQKQLASQVVIKQPPHHISIIAGLDCAFSADKKTCIAAVVLWDIERKKVIEQHIATSPVQMPYIPGLLSFREAPALLEALGKLQNTPDALMCDGHGIAHPRRLGIASHLGLFTQMATLGCGKSRLIGTHQTLKKKQGEQTPLMHKNEVMGTVLCTKNNTLPIFVSIGHQMDLASAEGIVWRCLNGYRLPEPTRLADRLVSETKKSIVSK